ncbi:hypothetical protein [Streptomyces sp. NPDC097981]|uniref:hypothetical protein n=1 Tax=Streptomyces sp. NPDC097981 TaxID=3155428 RepID=UPI0033249467
MNTHLRLLLTGALALLLLTSTIAAWAHPPQWRSLTTSVPVGAADSGPCDLLIGPARDCCTRGPGTAATVTGTSSAATAVPAAFDDRTGLTMFATLAISAAIAMVLTVERRAR